MRNPQDAEDRHELRLQPDRQQKRRRRDQHHHRHRRTGGEKLEMVDRAAGKRHRIQDDHAGRAERLRGHRVGLAGQPHAADQKPGADQEAARHADLGRDQVVFEGVFHAQRHAEEERQTAEPGKELHAHEHFPIDRRRRFALGLPRSHDWRRWDDRRHHLRRHRGKVYRQRRRHGGGVGRRHDRRRLRRASHNHRRRGHINHGLRRDRHTKRLRNERARRRHRRHLGTRLHRNGGGQFPKATRRSQILHLLRQLVHPMAQPAHEKD